MKRFTITTLLLALLCSTAFSQNREEIKKQINSIKKNTEYIYADVTAENAQDAHHMAEGYLAEEIKRWAATQKELSKSKNIIINDKKEIWSTLEMERGSDMFRAFIYVKKSDLLPGQNVQVIENTNYQADENIAPAQVKFADAAVQIASLTKYSDAGDALKTLKAQGKVISYARYESVTNADEYYLIIYNREGNVAAVLSPAPNRLNVKTGKPDSTKNYPRHGATCFKAE